MKFNERMNSESLSAQQENLSLIDFARVLLGLFRRGLSLRVMKRVHTRSFS